MTAWRETTRQAIAAHLSSRQVTRVIYGSIIGLAVLLTLERHPPSSAVVVSTLIGTAVAVALAELYSEWIGDEARRGRRPNAAEVHGMLRNVAAVAFGIAFPVVFFLLAIVGLIDDDDAFDYAQWSGLGLIALYGFAAARLARMSLGRSLLQALFVGLIATGLIALKALVH